MKKLSKLLALLLTVCMIFSMLPTFAFAEDAPAAAPDAAPVEAAASADASEAEAPAIDDEELQALDLLAEELQADDIVKTFASDADAKAAGYVVKVEGNATGYFKTFDHYVIAATNGKGAKKGSVVTFLDDVTIDDTSAATIKGTAAVEAVGAVFGVTASPDNSASHYAVISEASGYSNQTNDTVIDLNGHTLSYTGERNIISTNRYGLTIKNGKIVRTNKGSNSRNVVNNSSTTGATANSNKTTAYDPKFTFEDLEAYCDSCVFFSSYNWNPTVTVKNCKIVTTTGAAVFQLNKANVKDDVFVASVAPLATLTISKSIIGTIAPTTKSPSGVAYYNGYKASATSYDADTYNFYSSNKAVGSVNITVDKDTQIIHVTDDVCCKAYKDGFHEPEGLKAKETENVSLTFAGKAFTAPFVRSYESATQKTIVIENAAKAAAAPAIAFKSSNPADGNVFADDAAAADAGYFVKVTLPYADKVFGRTEFYFNQFNQYVMNFCCSTGVWDCGNGTTYDKVATVTLLANADITVETSEADVAAADVQTWLGDFGYTVTSAASNGTSAWMTLPVVSNAVTGNHDKTPNKLCVALDLNEKTLIFRSDRNLFNGTRYGMSIKNGTILYQGIATGRSIVCMSSSTAIVATSSGTGELFAGDILVDDATLVSYVNSANGVIVSNNWIGNINFTNSTAVAVTSAAGACNGAVGLAKSTNGGAVPTASPDKDLSYHVKVNVDNSVVGGLSTNDANKAYAFKVPVFKETDKADYKYEINISKGSKVLTCTTYTNFFSTTNGDADLMKATVHEAVTPLKEDSTVTLPALDGTTAAIAGRIYTYAEPNEAASYTTKAGVETKYTTLTEAFKAAQADADATAAVANGTIKLLKDVELTSETGWDFEPGKDKAPTGNGFFNAPQKAIDLDLDGHTITNAGTQNFIFATSQSPVDLHVKIYNGTYLGTNSGGRSILASCSTSSDTAAVYHVAEFKDMVILSSGATSTINSFDANMDMTLDNCKVYNIHADKVTTTVNLAMGTTADQADADNITYAPKLTLKNGTLIGAARGYGLNLAVKYSVSGKTSIEITNRNPEIVLDGNVTIYGNSDDDNYSVKDYESNKKFFTGWTEEVVTTGWALDATGAETTAPAKGKLSYVAPDASYKTVAGVETNYATLKEAFQAAAADPDVTATVCGEIKLLKDVTIDDKTETGKWVGNQGNGLVADSDPARAYDVNLNGKTLTNNYFASLFMFVNNGYATISVHDGTYIGNGARCLVALGSSGNENAGAAHNGYVINLKNLTAVVHGTNQVISSNMGGTKLNIENSTLAHQKATGQVMNAAGTYVDSSTTYAIYMNLSGTDGSQVYTPEVNIKDSTLYADHYCIGLAVNTAKGNTITNPQPSVKLSGDVHLVTKYTTSPFANGGTFYKEPFVTYKFVDPYVTIAMKDLPDFDGTPWSMDLCDYHYYQATIIASGTCGTGLTWTLDSDGNLVIEGEGAMDASAASYWGTYKTQIKTITIGDKVSSIDANAFVDCTALTTVTILNGEKTPTALTTIGSNAFDGCTSFTDVYYPRTEELWNKVAGHAQITTPVTVHCAAACVGDAHTYTDFVIIAEPTCTEPGESQAECIICGDIKSTILPAGNHEWDDGVQDADPTCTEPGNIHYTCKKCPATKDEPIAALGHDFKPTGKTIREPSCYLPGAEEAQCQRCPATDEIPIDPTGHTFVDDVCTSCGAHHFTPTNNDGTPIQPVGRSTAWDPTTNTIERLGADDPLDAYFDFASDAEAEAAGMRVHYRSYSGTHDHYFMDLAIAFSYGETKDTDSNSSTKPCTITLLDDLDLDHELWYAGNGNMGTTASHKFATMRRSVVLDMNGHTMEANGNYNIFSMGTNSTITLTVKNGTVIHNSVGTNGRGFVCCGTTTGAVATSAGVMYEPTITLENLLYQSTGTAPMASSYWYGTTYNIKNCTVYSNTANVTNINKSTVAVAAGTVFAPVVNLQGTTIYCGRTDKPLVGLAGATFNYGEGTEIYAMDGLTNKATVACDPLMTVVDTVGEFPIDYIWDGKTETTKTFTHKFTLEAFGSPSMNENTYFQSTANNLYYTVAEWPTLLERTDPEITIKLIKDLDSDLEFALPGTLDLDGHTVSGSVTVTNGDAVVTNGTLTGAVTAQAGTLTLDNVNIISTDTENLTVTATSGKVIIGDATVTAPAGTDWMAKWEAAKADTTHYDIVKVLPGAESNIVKLQKNGTPDPTDDSLFYSEEGSRYFATLDEVKASGETNVALLKDLDTALTVDVDGLNLNLSNHNVPALNITGKDASITTGNVNGTVTATAPVTLSKLTVRSDGDGLALTGDAMVVETTVLAKGVGVTCVNATLNGVTIASGDVGVQTTGKTDIYSSSIVASKDAILATGATLTVNDSTVEGGTSGSGYAIDAANGSACELSNAILASSNDYPINSDSSTVVFNSGVAYVPQALFVGNKWFNGSGVSFSEGSLYRNSQQRIIENSATGERSTNTYYCVTTDSPVAKIGSVCYRTLNEAIQSASDGDTILLCADTVVENEIAAMAKATDNVIFSVKKSITIDLNGHTVTGTQAGVTSVDKRLFTISTGNGTVTIKNGNIYNPSTANYALIFGAIGTTVINLENVNLVTMYRGIFASSSSTNATTVNIIGGTYVGLSTSSNYPVYAYGGAVYHLSGGVKVAQNYTNAIGVGTGTLYIDDATVYSKSVGGVSVTGGTLIGTQSGNETSVKLENFVTGSVTYANATSYAPVVEPNVSYNQGEATTLEDALSQAKAAGSGTVTLLGSNNISKPLTLASGVLLDMNGKNITFSNGGSLIVEENATVVASSEAALQSKGELVLNAGSTLILGDKEYNIPETICYDYRLNIQKVSLSMLDKVNLNVKLSADAAALNPVIVGVDGFEVDKNGSANYTVFRKAIDLADYNQTWTVSAKMEGVSGLPRAVGIEEYAHLVLSDTSAKESLKNMVLAMLNYAQVNGTALTGIYDFSGLKTEPTTWTDATAPSNMATVDTSSFNVVYNATSDLTFAATSFYGKSLTGAAASGSSYTFNQVMVPEINMQITVKSAASTYTESFASLAKANGSDGLKAAVIFGEYANDYFSGK